MAEAERTIGEMIKLAQELPDFSIIKSFHNGVISL